MQYNIETISDSNPFIDGERGNSIVIGPSVQTRRLNPLDRKPNKAIIIPEVVRDFTEAELEFLYKLIYGRTPESSKSKKPKKAGKPLKPSKRSKKSIALDNVKKTIHILEVNGALKKNGFRLAVKELGKIFGSNDTAQMIIECLELGKVVLKDNHYDPKLNIARLFKIHDNFKHCEAWKDLKEKITLETVEPEPIINEPETIMITEPINEIEEQSPEEIKAQEIMTKAASKWTRQRFLALGLDPDSKQTCCDCGEDFPVVMYSLKDNQINRKCKLCWEGLSEKPVQEDITAIQEELRTLKKKFGSKDKFQARYHELWGKLF